MKIRYTHRALTQLDDIYAYIENESPASANRVKRRIQNSINRLARFPYLARVTSNPAIRAIPILPYPYLVFYTINEKAEVVQILRIRHAAQNPKQHLE